MAVQHQSMVKYASILLYEHPSLEAVSVGGVLWLAYKK
jgi:hypothetical protein